MTSFQRGRTCRLSGDVGIEALDNTGKPTGGDTENNKALNRGVYTHASRMGSSP